MKKLLMLTMLMVSGHLHAECLSCIVPRSQHQPDGRVVEWVEKKCRKTQRYIKKGTNCSRCGCPREKHTRRRNEYAYHNGKKLKSEHIGSVKMGDIMPEIGQER